MYTSAHFAVDEKTTQEFLSQIEAADLVTVRRRDIDPDPEMGTHMRDRIAQMGMKAALKYRDGGHGEPAPHGEPVQARGVGVALVRVDKDLETPTRTPRARASFPQRASAVPAVAAAGGQGQAPHR